MRILGASFFVYTFGFFFRGVYGCPGGGVVLRPVGVGLWVVVWWERELYLGRSLCL